MTEELKLIDWDERAGVTVLANAGGISNRPMPAAGFCLMIHQRMPRMTWMSPELCGFLAARLMMSAGQRDIYEGTDTMMQRARAIFEETIAADAAQAKAGFEGMKALAERPAGTVAQ